jgi:hypothetical protein
MGIPVAVGVPEMDSKLFPVWLSKQVMLAYRERSVIEAITTTDHTAELQQGGTTVNITGIPAITNRAYTKGAETLIEHVDPTTIQLVIDKARYWAYPIYKIDQRQAVLKSYWNQVAQEAGKDMAEKIELDFLADIIDDGHAQNMGATAGPNANINLGTAASPITVTKDTIISVLLRTGAALSYKKVDKTAGRWALIDPVIAQMIKESPLGSTYITGDASSPLRHGEIGKVDRSILYETTQLPITESGAIPIIFGHKRATIFFTQMQDAEQAQGRVDIFSKIMAGIQVYGYKVYRPEGLGVLWVTV